MQRSHSSSVAAVIEVVIVTIQQLNKSMRLLIIFISIICSMLDFLVLAVFAYLIFRVVLKIFSNIEQLFARPASVPSSLNSTRPNSQKPIQVSLQANPYVPSPIPSPEQGKPLLVDNRFSSQKVEKLQSNPYQEFQRQEREKRKFEEAEEKISELQMQLEESHAENERLREEIEGHKTEKAGYVARIEEIIQHVIDSQAPAPEIPASLQNDAEMKALGQLTKEIDHAHQLEVQKLKEREQELLDRMQREEESLKRDYEAQIKQMQQRITELTSKAESPQKISSPILTSQKQQQLQQQLNIANLELEQLRDRLSEAQQQIAQLTNNERAIHQHQGESSHEEIEKLLIELSEADKECKDLRGKLQRQQQENIQLRENQERLLGEIDAVQRKADDFHSKLKQLREESSINENDKLQADIRLQAQIQSLVQQKEEMEGQIALLNENLFKEEQERNQIINQIKQQLVTKYEAELEASTKNLEKAQQDRRQAERKLQELQSELEFVQTQLKNTMESERTLTAEIDALKSPKKEKVSLTEVQGHAEYLKLKRKVEDLESEISKSRTQNAEEIKQVPADRKINYARTKVERQASPTFQFEPKERTPPKVETSSSRSKDVVSTIFASNVEKTRSPTSQRYQTPMQKPVAQSSILEGGLLSEGFLGETSILGQQQREFLIGEIKTLKKIDVKKARMLYRSLGSNPRPISEYTSNVPNVLVVVQLSNKKLLGAFTQAAFTRELGGHPERKYTPANKAMIIDISQERIILNSSASDTIRYDEHALIWGRNEFIVSSEEPLLLTCDLNCENAVYPCNLSSQELLGGAGRSCPISQFEVYRIFLG